MSTTPSPAAPAPAELGYDPWDPAFISDPYSALARILRSLDALAVRT